MDSIYSRVLDWVSSLSKKKKIFLAIHCLTPHQGPTSSASWWLKTSPGSRWAVSPAGVKQVGSGRQSVVKETQVSLCLLWTLDIWEQSRSPSPRHTRLVSVVAFAEGGRSRSRGQEEKDEEGASAWHREEWVVSILWTFLSHAVCPGLRFSGVGFVERRGR